MPRRRRHASVSFVGDTRESPGRQEVSKNKQPVSVGRSVWVLVWTNRRPMRFIGLDWILRVGSVRVAFGIVPIEVRVGAMCDARACANRERFGLVVAIYGYNANARSSLASRMYEQTNE